MLPLSSLVSPRSGIFKYNARNNNNGNTNSDSVPQRDHDQPHSQSCSPSTSSSSDLNCPREPPRNTYNIDIITESCTIYDNTDNSECDILCVVEDYQDQNQNLEIEEEKKDMADNRSEVVSSSRKATRQQRQESQILQQQQQQSSSQIQSSQKTESSSTVVNMISTSNIQLKQKQEMSNQIQSQTQSQSQIQSQTTVTQKSKMQMQSSFEKQSKIESATQLQSINQSNQNSSQQNFNVTHQQKQVQQKQQTSIQQTQQQQQQQLLQQQQEQLQLQQKRQKEQQQQLESIENDDEDNREEDLKVTEATNNDIVDEENDLYFSNLIRQEQILNTENSYCLSDDVQPVSVSVVDNLVDVHNYDDTENESNSLIIHSDLISSGMESPLSQPPSLVQCVNVLDGHLIDEDRDRHDDPSHEVSSISSKSCEDSCSIGQDQQSLGGDAEEEEEEDDDDLDDDYEDQLNDVRKKKKKVKKTESFSVIELLDDKMKNLADKYEVMTNNHMIGPSCELRACEKRVFEKVSVANLRRSFCDLTSQNQHDEDEFNFHLVERPKSSFSKFENVANANNTNGSSQEDHERVIRNNKNENKSGTGICKGCGQEVFVMEMVKAEKSSWHKNCFRCSECKKPLSVDTYESNAGLLYCKPHFRELFQPKAVFESPEEMLMKRIKKRPEVIIRENQPVELPPDVVRASIQPSTAELEDLSVDVKSKFELFEHFKDNQHTEEKREPVIVKRSTSVLAKLAKYEGSMDMDGQIGISDHDLNGGAPTVVSDDDDEEQRATQKHLEEINYKMDDMKSKWESGMNSKKEEIHKHRQEELAKFRTRLCLGKNSQLKEMYEKAVESSADDVKKATDLDELDLKGKRNIMEMFEKGTVNNRSIDEDDVDPRETTVDRDRDVFENGVAKTSRNLFESLDKQLVTGGGQVSPSPGGPKKISFKNPSGIVGVNDPQAGEIVKSSDVIQDEFKSEDVGSKFRFFETFQDSQNNEKKRKVFRITPPREGQVKMDSPEREIYRDPNVVRSTDAEETKVPVGRTASKMLSVFKKLEEIAAGSDEVDHKSRRPLKQFTPPRETRIQQNGSSEEEEEQSGSEYETDDEEPYENGTNGNGANQEEDQFLKEVGSLARAKSLRAKFEKWEIEENSKNQRDSAKIQEDGLNGGGSIESAKALRARFEQPQQFDQPKQAKREVQVKRFVELQNNNVNMEECVMCNKKVYAMEKTEAGGKIYHKNCFRCSQCKCVLRMGTFTQNKGTLYCTPHFKQLFKIKGNYDEGFGHETGKQIWMKKQQAKLATESGESKEN